MIKIDLIDSMGSDMTVVNAARVSFGRSVTEVESKDERLIRFLANHKHVTPFRHPSVSFRCKAPIALARQLGKHQVGFSWNEMSRRYKDGDVEFFLPDVIMQRPDNLHDGAGEAFEGEAYMARLRAFELAYKGADAAYTALLASGVAPEQARFVLPQGMMTEWVWTGSLYGWFEVYRQRISDHAQYDVREFARLLDVAMSTLFPISWNALKEANIQ